MINLFVCKKKKRYYYWWQDCSENSEKLGFLNSYFSLHDAGTDSCTLFSLLMRYFILFNVSYVVGITYKVLKTICFLLFSALFGV
jgi:hypothetical protein